MNKMISKHQDVPVIGKYYYFFDDGNDNSLWY